MEGHFKDSPPSIEGTDELPVLSEEAILRFEGKPDPADTRSLESSVEALRQTLDQAEARWRGLESELESQNQAISELKAALGKPPVVATAPAPKPAQATSREPQAASLRTAKKGKRYEGISPAQLALLERIDSLESYIAGRADRWREMERELTSKAQRITELESELNQRILREQQLADRLHDEGDKSDALRDKLREVSRRLEASEVPPEAIAEVPAATVATPDLELTRELPAEEIDAAGPAPTATDESPEDLDAASSATLICLTSEMHERYQLRKQTITIGRAADCDIRILTDYVSRLHATIERVDDDAIIEDRSSTNGVFVNKVRVDRQQLKFGDEITIGQSRFRYVENPESESK